MTTPYAPTLFAGTAAFYLRGCPPYSRALPEFLAREADLRGRRALDVGCGPGTVAVDLALHAAEVVGLDPDGEMLAEAERHTGHRGVANLRWVLGRAEDLGTLDLGRSALITFAQSFHWTDREAVANLVYDLLEPGGVLALIGHEVRGCPQPAGPGFPPIPPRRSKRCLTGTSGRSGEPGRGRGCYPPSGHEDVLARTRFGRPETIYRPSREASLRSFSGSPTTSR